MKTFEIKNKHYISLLTNISHHFTSDGNLSDLKRFAAMHKLHVNSHNGIISIHNLRKREIVALINLQN